MMKKSMRAKYCLRGEIIYGLVGILITLFVFINFFSINGCAINEFAVPNYERPDLQKMQSSFSKLSSLPDDYTRINPNPTIDRPVVVILEKMEHPAPGRPAKNTAIVQTRDMYYTQGTRQVLINRLLATGAFRQILPHEDAQDPSLAPDTLVLEYSGKQEAENRVPYPSSGSMPTHTVSTMVLRDLTSRKSVSVDLQTKNEPHSSGMEELYCEVDSMHDYKELSMSKSGYYDIQANWMLNCWDKAIERLLQKFEEQGL
jgi:hypothetical protein